MKSANARAVEFTWITCLSVAAAATFRRIGAVALFALSQAEAGLFQAQVEQARLRAASARQLLSEGRPDAALALALAAFPDQYQDNWQDIDRFSQVTSPLVIASATNQLRLVLRGPESTVLSVAFAPMVRGSPPHLPTVSRGFGTSPQAPKSPSCGDMRAGSRASSSLPTGPALPPHPGRRHRADLERRYRRDSAPCCVGTSTGYVALLSPRTSAPASPRRPGTAPRVSGTPRPAPRLPSCAGIRVRWQASPSPHGARLATASFDRTARIWSGTTGTSIAVLLVARGPVVVSSAFAPDGALLATASHDGTVRIGQLRLAPRPPSCADMEPR